eukprot:g10894.t1
MLILVRKKLGLAVLLLVLFLLPCTTRAAAAADRPDPATKYLLYDWHPMFQAGLSLIQSTMEKSDRLTLVVEDIYNRRNQMKTRTFSQALDPCLRTFPKNYLLALKSGGPPPRKWLNQKALLAFTSVSVVDTMKKDPHRLDFVEEPPGPAPFLIYENMILERVEKHNYYCPVVKPDVYTFHGRYFDKHFQFRFDGKTQCGHRKHIPVALTIHQDMEHLLQLDAMAAAAAKEKESGELAGHPQGPASVSNVRGSSDEGDDWGGAVTAEAIELEAAEKKHQLRRLEHQGRESHIVVDKQSGGFIASLLPTMATDAWSGTHGNYNAESTASSSPSTGSSSTRKLDTVGDADGGGAAGAEGTTSLTEGAIMNKPMVLTLRVPHLGRNLLSDHTPDLDLLDGGRECLRRDFGDFFQDHDICVLFGGKRSPSVCAGSMAERIYYVPFLMFSFIRSHDEYATFVDQDLPKVKASVAPSFLDMGFLEYASGVGNFVQEQQIWYTRKYLLEQKRVRKEFDMMHSDAVWDPAEGEEPLKRNNFVLIGGRKLPGSHGGASGDDAVLSFYLNLVGRMVTDLQRRLRSFYKSNLALQERKKKMREGSMVEKSPPPRPAEEVAQGTLVKTSKSPDEDGNVIMPEQEKEALRRIGLHPADKDLCFWPRYRNLKDYKRFGCEVKIRTMLEEFADDQALVRNDDFLCEDSCGRTVLDPLHGLNDYAEWAVASRQASVPAVQKRPAGIQGAADMGMAAQGVCITYGPLLCRKYKMDKDRTLIRVEAAGDETGKNPSVSRHLPLDETQRVNAISMRDIDNSEAREQKALMNASERRKRVFYPPSAAAAKPKTETPSSTPPRKVDKKVRSHWPVIVETFPRHFSQRHFSFEQVLRDVKALVCFPYSSSALFWSEMHALGIPIFIPSIELLWQYHLQVQLGAKYANLRKNVKFMATPLDINKVQSMIDDNVLVLDRRAKANARAAAVAGAGAGAAKKGGVSPNVAKTIAEWLERQEEQELRRQIGEEAFEKLGKEFRKSLQSTREPNVVAPSKVITNQEGFWFPQQESVFFHDEDAQPTRQKWQIMPGNRTHRMQMRLVRAWFDKTKIFSKTEWANVTGVNATSTLRDEFYATRAPGAAHGLIANEILASMHPAGNSSRGFDARFPEESIVLGGEEPELSPWRMFESRTAFYYWLGKMDLYHWGPHVRHYHNVSHLFSMIKDHELLDAMRRRQLVRSKEMNERGEQVFRAAMEEIKQGEAYKERGRGR